MKYALAGATILVPVRRTDIIDISVNDVITVAGFPDVQYTWTHHDSEFLENNPDDDIFVEIERSDDSQFRAVGIVLRKS